MALIQGEEASARRGCPAGQAGSAAWPLAVPMPGNLDFSRDNAGRGGTDVRCSPKEGICACDVWGLRQPAAKELKRTFQRCLCLIAEPQANDAAQGCPRHAPPGRYAAVPGEKRAAKVVVGQPRRRGG